MIFGCELNDDDDGDCFGQVAAKASWQVLACLPGCRLLCQLQTNGLI